MLTDEVHAENGSARQGSRGGRCLSVLFSIFSVPCGKPQFFSVEPESLPLFLFPFAYAYFFFFFFLNAVTCGGLGEQCCRNIELLREM